MCSLPILPDPPDATFYTNITIINNVLVFM